VGIIEDLRHCIDNPSDGPVIADALEVQFPDSPPAARLLVIPNRIDDEDPPTDPRDCADPTVGDAARFLSKHLEGEWHPAGRFRPDGEGRPQNATTDAVVWELTRPRRRPRD